MNEQPMQELPQPDFELMLNNKDELEKTKLKAEIKNLTKPVYQKIEFWSAISTGMIAVITVFVLYNNGAFDIKTKNLEIQKNILQFEIEKFKKDTIGYAYARVVLEDYNKILKYKSDSIVNKIIADSLRTLELMRIIAEEADKLKGIKYKKLPDTN